MRVPLLLPLCAALALACLAAARLADGTVFQTLASQAAEAERLDRALAVTRACRRFKDGLARDLARGRLTLAEAIARLRRYLDDEAPPEGGPTPWSGRDSLRMVKGGSDDERCGRNLIRLVEVHLRGSPDVAPDVVVRLERELEEYLTHRGRGR